MSHLFYNIIGFDERTPILAEDIPPTVLLVFLVPLFLLILAIFSLSRIGAAVGSSREIRSGVTKRVILVLGGGLFLFTLLTVRGDAPITFYGFSALLLIVGLWSLYRFGRKIPEASRQVSITFRVLLYGFFALVLIGLCAKLLAR